MKTLCNHTRGKYIKLFLSLPPLPEAHLEHLLHILVFPILRLSRPCLWNQHHRVAYKSELQRQKFPSFYFLCLFSNRISTALMFTHSRAQSNKRSYSIEQFQLSLRSLDTAHTSIALSIYRAEAAGCVLFDLQWWRWLLESSVNVQIDIYVWRGKEAFIACAMNVNWLVSLSNILKFKKFTRHNYSKQF